MKRFDYFEDDEENDDEESESLGRPLTPKEYKELIEEERALQQQDVELSYIDLNQKLLQKTIKLCEKSLFWNFYSLQTKLNMISKAFLKLKNLQEY